MLDWSWGIPQAISPLVQMKKNAAFLGCAEWPASGHSSCGGGLAGFYQPGALALCATCVPFVVALIWLKHGIREKTETAINKLNKSVQKFFCFDCFLQKQEFSFNSALCLPVPTFKTSLDKAGPYRSLTY